MHSRRPGYRSRAPICVRSIEGGAAKLKPLLQALAEQGDADGARMPTSNPKPPTLVLSIDQGEELFLAEAQDEAQPFLALAARSCSIDDAPAVIAVFTIRSDNYERLQLATELEGVHQETLSLPPMPKGSYAEVIKGPARRLEGTARALKIEDALVDALLADIEAGGAKDALPLLAFTLERLYGEYDAGGNLKLADYDALGRVKGSIEAAVERAFKAADADPAIPRDRVARLALLRRGLIPWLAGIDPDTGAPRRRVARLSEIPAEARPLIQHLVEQRLLATDVAQGHRARPPSSRRTRRCCGNGACCRAGCTEDAGLLAVLEGVKRAAAIGRRTTATRPRLARARGRSARRGGAAVGAARPRRQSRADRSRYIAACRKAEADAKRRQRLLQGAVYASLVAIILALVGWINQDFLKAQWGYWTVTYPYMRSRFGPTY